MDQGTYNNVVRGNNPLSPVSSPSPSGTSYKTNVNRTKTRKWVEAKIQSYDGDDWGNEYDDIDDEPDEPPPPTRPTGLRQPGQSSQRPLPSTRTFSQPAATFESHMPGSSALRNPSGPPALHVQTQQSPPLVQSSMMPYERAPSMSPDLYAPGSGRLASHSPPVQIQSGGPSKQPEYYPVASPASQIGPASPSNTSATSSRFPPRKSSMSRQDIPDFSSDTGATRSGSRPASSSSNRGTIGTAAKPPTFVRPADIYRRVEEEREKERISMELVRPSMESVFGRNDHSSSPANAIRSPTEQRRRTSFESHDGSDAGRGMRTTLAPVAERKSEYGMDRFLDKSQGQSLPGEFSQLSSVEAQQAPSHEPAGDEAQVADVVKSRRLSTSPKLPDFARMSGFGDDFFSSTSRRDSQAAASLPPTQQTEKPAEKELGSSSLHSTEQPPPSMLEGPKLQANPDVIMPLPSEQTAIPQTVSSMPPDQPSAVRPRLPGTWVSETVSTASEQPTPMEKSEGSRALPPSSLQNIEVPPSGGETSEPADVQPTTKVKQLPGEDHVTHTTIETKEPVDSKRGTFTTPAGEHDDVVASKAIASGPGLHPAPPVLPPLKTENPLTHPGAPLANEIPTQQHSVDAPTAIWKDTPVLTSPTTQRNTATGKSEYSPTAPLNPHRSGLDQADAITPDTQERKSTLSSIATASPQKESDKLREEIIKSLSPSPLSTLDTSTTPAQPTGSPEPSQGTLTRESTYLSGVYDDYLSPVEEKSLRETSETPRQGHNMPSGYDTGGNSPPGESPMANVAPLNPRKSPEPGPSSRPRRFSWDQGPEQVTISPVDPKLESINFPEYSTSDATAGVTNDNRPSPSDGLKPEPEATGIISHRVSQVSSRAPDELAAGPLEPPSPVSFVAEVNSKSQPATINRDSYLSLAEEKESVLIPPTSRSTSPESQHPALSKAADPAMQTALAAEQTAPTLTTPQPKIMSFREILNIASTEQRIRKLEETRAQFAAMDSGLSNWLEQIRSEVEHADTAAAAAGGASPGPISPAQPSPSGVRPSTQQPYYQQYLNASASGSAGGQTGRTSSGNLQHMFSGQPGSGFGGSGNQVGAKSKELLHAAGAFGNKGMKSGMKLFNKGKSKLRGTGDKEPPSPPPPGARYPTIAPTFPSIPEPKKQKTVSFLFSLPSPPSPSSSSPLSRTERRSTWGVARRVGSSLAASNASGATVLVAPDREHHPSSASRATSTKRPGRPPTTTSKVIRGQVHQQSSSLSSLPSLGRFGARAPPAQHYQPSYSGQQAEPLQPQSTNSGSNNLNSSSLPRQHRPKPGPRHTAGLAGLVLAAAAAAAAAAARRSHSPNLIQEPNSFEYFAHPPRTPPLLPVSSSSSSPSPSSSLPQAVADGPAQQVSPVPAFILPESRPSALLLATSLSSPFGGHPNRTTNYLLQPTPSETPSDQASQSQSQPPSQSRGPQSQPVQQFYQRPVPPPSLSPLHLNNYHHHYQLDPGTSSTPTAVASPASTSAVNPTPPVVLTSSPPPQLPPLPVSTRISPFGQSSRSSAADRCSPWAPPASDEQLAAPRQRSPRPEEITISPISATHSSPVFSNRNRDDELRLAHRDQYVPPQISKFPPARDPLSAIPLLGETGVGLQTSSQLHTDVAPVLSAGSLAAAHDVAHLKNTPNNRVEAASQTPPVLERTSPELEPYSDMTVAMAADRAHMPNYVDSTQQTSSSFTPLPPIRRTSTFDLLQNKGSGEDEGESADSPVIVDKDAPPVPPMPGSIGYQNGNGQVHPPHQNGYAPAHQTHLPSQPYPGQNNRGFFNGDGRHPASGQASSQQQMLTGKGQPGPQAYGQPGMPLVNGSGQPFMPQMGGNPIQRFPPGGQWKLEESHLSEPLNPSNKNRSAANSPPQQQPGYFAYDKETEGPSPPPPSGGASSQLVQTRQRNNSMPPVSAQRFPGLFQAAPAASQMQPQQQHSNHPAFRDQTNEGMVNGGKENDDPRSSKDMIGVRVDEVSISSVASDEVNPKAVRRGSGHFFTFGNRRNTDAEQGHQHSHSGGPEKKRTFFGSVTNLNPQKSSLGFPRSATLENNPSLNHSSGESVPVKKRLSELKGMIMGVGSAKEGAAKDEQSARYGAPQLARPSMQGPGPNSSGHGGPQRPPGSQMSPDQYGPMGPDQFGPPGPSGAPQMGMGRPSTSDMRPPQAQLAQGEEYGRRGSAAQFLGGLFTKQAGPKSKDSKTPPGAQMLAPGQRAMQLPHHAGPLAQPGQMSTPVQPLGPHPMYGQPPFQPGQQGQQTMQRPMMSGQQAFQPELSPIQSPLSPPGIFGAETATAQAVMMRRPSEITVSSQSGRPGSSGQRSIGPTHQPSQATIRPPNGPSPLGNSTTQQSDLHLDDELTNDSPNLSKQSSQDRLSEAESSVLPKPSPNRKPVGSAPSRPDGNSSNFYPNSNMQNPAGNFRPQPDRRISTQLPAIRHSPELDSPRSGNSQHTFLVTPAQSPLPSSPSPDHPTPQASQPLHNWEAETKNRVEKFMNPQPPRPPGSPAPSQDNTHVMAKFFGVGEAKGKNVPSQAVKDNKEKNAASRLLNAFRRVPKQPDSNQTTQQRPASGQPVARPGAPGQPGQGRGQMPQAGRGQMPAQVHIMQGGRGQMPPQMPMMQGGRGQMPPSIMQGGRGQAPPGQMHPGQVLQGPMPPQMQIMQGGRGQMPPQLQTIQGGRGQVPSQMQAGRGHIPPGQVPTGQMPSHPQALMPGQRPPVGPGKGEPQYDHVPIPRGYQAVHGYGPGVMLAPSPYDIGRPSPPPATQYPPHPFQGMMPTPGPQQQQWDPRMALPPHGMVPYGQPQPQQHGQPGFMQQPAQKPPQQSPQHSEPQQQPIMRQIPPNQIPISSTAQQNYSQYPANVAIQPVSQPSQEHIQSLPPQQPQSQDQFNSQHPQSVDSQTPSTSNWGSAPANTHNPQSQRRVNSHSQPSPVPENPAEDAGSIPAGSQKFQPQHIASAMNNEDAYSRPPQSDPSGGNQVAAQPPLKRLPEVPSPSGSQSKEPTQATSQESLNIPSQRDGAVSPEVGRLTSRMSQIHEPPRKTSLSPEIVDERAMSVSPEPPLTRRPAPGPSHKVSEPSLDVNAERANTQMKDPDEDLYDVTPRMNHHAHMPHHGHENIKYAGSEKGRAIPNGAGGLGTAAAAAAGGAIIGAGASTDATAAASSTTTSSTADEYDAEFGHPTPPVQQVRKQPTIQFNDEPEEKILIEDPVELPAVNDDDDGIPMMSATSYPGQEWNPYGAGEFGDWD